MATKKKPPMKKLTIREWTATGRKLKAAEVRLRDTEFTHQWAIADWILAGMKVFGKEKALGNERTYEIASKATGMTEDTLQQFAHTARRVLIRVKGVSFGHHRLVAKLKGAPSGANLKKKKLSPAEERKNRKKLQHTWLIKARDKHWSVADLDLHLKADKQDEGQPRSAAIAADRLVKKCGELLTHWGLDKLREYEPPAMEVRKIVIQKLKDTADNLNRSAEDLKAHWEECDAFSAMKKARGHAAGGAS